MWIVAALLIAASPPDEVERVRTHLRVVEAMLRARSDTESPARTASLDRLHAYWLAGRFPENTHHPDRRMPYFIDDFGTPCAVADLLIDSGAGAIAGRIAKTNNFIYAEEIEDPEFIAWAATSGLALDELALIQPTYDGPTWVDEAMDRKDFAFLEKHFVGGKATTWLLQRAISRNKESVVEWLLKKGADPSSALRGACWSSSNPAILRALVKAGARLEDPADDWPSVLYEMIARYRKRWSVDSTRMIETLLDLGADINRVADHPPRMNVADGVHSVKGGTALDLAMCEEDEELIALLKKHGAKSTGAYEECLAAFWLDHRYEEGRFAIQREHPDIGALERAFRRGPRGLKLDVNSTGRSNFTLLRWAVRQGSYLAVKTLLERGADPHRDDLLVDAAQYGAVDVAELLLARGVVVRDQAALADDRFLKDREAYKRILAMIEAR